MLNKVKDGYFNGGIYYYKIKNSIESFIQLSDDIYLKENHQKKINIKIIDTLY